MTEGSQSLQCDRKWWIDRQIDRQAKPGADRRFRRVATL
jgi:hypothetical protein